MSRNDQVAKAKAGIPPPRFKWPSRFPVRAFLPAILIAAILVGWWTVRSAASTRRQESLRGSRAMADMASRLIDEKCEIVRVVLSSLGAGELSLAPDGQAIQRAFRSASALTPSPTSLELYGSDGKRLAGYPSSPPESPAIEADEIQRALKEIRSSRSRVLNRSSEASDGFAIAVPFEDAGHSLGVLVASYQAEVLGDWLAPLWDDADRAIYVVDDQGRTVAASRASPPVANFPDDYEPTRLALENGSGSTQALAPDGKEPALVGYALARVPRWSVLAVQSTNTALGPMRRLRNGLFVGAGLTAFVLLIAAWFAFAEVRNFRPRQLAREPATKSAPQPQRDRPVPVPPEPRSQPPEPAMPPAVMFVKEGSWKVLSMSVTGRSHVRTGHGCQDTSYCKVLNQTLLVGAVADGAGSAPHGDQGARVAAQLAVDTLAAHATTLKPSDSDQQWNRLLLAAMEVARGHIEVNAAVRNKPARQLATTLILFAAMPDMIVAAQIGDGAIVIRDEHGAVQSLTRPQSGEYINTTTFLVSPDAFKTVQQQVWRRPYSDIAALTDGLQMLALTMPQGDAHAPFFLPLFEFASKATGAEEALGELRGFLQSERITARVDDDMTLMLAHIER